MSAIERAEVDRLQGLDLMTAARALVAVKEAFEATGRLHQASQAYLAELHVRQIFIQLTGIPMMLNGSEAMASRIQQRQFNQEKIA